MDKTNQDETAPGGKPGNDLENPPSKEAGSKDSGENQLLLVSTYNAKTAPSGSGLQKITSTLLNRPRSQSLSGHVSNPQETDWTTKLNKKRLRNSPDDQNQNRNSKQPKIKDYWLAAPIQTRNRFESLDSNGNDIENPSIQEVQYKPPSLFVDGVSNIQPLTQLLKELVGNEYELKVLRNEQVKIQLKTSMAYTTIVNNYNKKERNFTHTNQRRIEVSEW